MIGGCKAVDKNYLRVIVSLELKLPAQSRICKSYFFSILLIYNNQNSSQTRELNYSLTTHFYKKKMNVQIHFFTKVVQFCTVMLNSISQLFKFNFSNSHNTPEIQNHTIILYYACLPMTSTIQALLGAADCDCCSSISSSSSSTLSKSNYGSTTSVG